jgi:polyphosphate kinase 2 (PPK2 family)
MPKGIKLSKISTKAPKELKKGKIVEESKELFDQIYHLQHVIYAEKKHSVLVIFQGIDGSGKDGATKHVFSGCSPQGIRLEAFKAQ